MQRTEVFLPTMATTLANTAHSPIESSAVDNEKITEPATAEALQDASVPMVDKEQVATNIPKIIIPVTSADSMYGHLNESQRMLRLKTLQIIQNCGFSTCDTLTLNALADYGLNVATAVLSRSELRSSASKRPRLVKLQDIMATLCSSSSPITPKDLLDYIRWRRKQSSFSTFLNTLPSIKVQAPANDEKLESGGASTTGKRSVTFALPLTFDPSVTASNEHNRSSNNRPTFRTIDATKIRPPQNLVNQSKNMHSNVLQTTHWPAERRPEWLDPELAYPAPPPGFEYLLANSMTALNINNANAAAQKHSSDPSAPDQIKTTQVGETPMDVESASGVRDSLVVENPTASSNYNNDAGPPNIAGDAGALPQPVKKKLPVYDDIPSFVPRDPLTGKPQWELAFLVPRAPLDTSPFIPPKLAVIKPAPIRSTFGDSSVKSNKHRAKATSSDAEYDNDEETEEVRRRRKEQKRREKREKFEKQNRTDKQDRQREKDRHYDKQHESSKHDRRRHDGQASTFSPVESRPPTRVPSAVGMHKSYNDNRSPSSPITLALAATPSATTSSSSKSFRQNERASIAKPQAASPAVLSPKPVDERGKPKISKKHDTKADADTLSADESEERSKRVRTPPEPIKITISRPVVAVKNATAESSPADSSSKKLKKKKKKKHREEKHHKHDRTSSKASPESAGTSASPVAETRQQSDAEEDVSPVSARVSKGSPAEAADANRERSVASSDFEISESMAPDVMQDELLQLKQNILKDLQNGAQQPDMETEGEIEEPVVMFDKKKKKKKRKHAKREKQTSRNENISDSSAAASSAASPEQARKHDENEQPPVAIKSIVDKSAYAATSSESESIIDPYVPAKKTRKGRSKKTKKSDDEEMSRVSPPPPAPTAVPSLQIKIPSLKIKLNTTSTNVAAPSPEIGDEVFSPVAPAITSVRRLAEERESPLSPDEENDEPVDPPVNILASKPQSDAEDETAGKVHKKKEKKKKKKKEKKHRKDAERTPPKPTDQSEDSRQSKSHAVDAVPPPVEVTKLLTVAPAEPKKPLKLLLKLNKQTEQSTAVKEEPMPAPQPVKVPSPVAAVPHKKDKKKKKRVRSPSRSSERENEAEEIKPKVPSAPVPVIAVKSPPAVTMQAKKNDAVDDESDEAKKSRKKQKTSNHKRSVTEKHERSQAVDLPLESSTTMRLTVKDTPAVSALPSPTESAAMSPAAAPPPKKEKSTPTAPPKNLEKTGEVLRETNPDKWYEWPPPPDAVNDPEKYGYPLEWLMEYTEDGQYWQCPTCTWKDNGRLPMVGCDGPCEGWFHYPCVGLRTEPTHTKWYCPSCRAEPNKSWLPKPKKRAAANDGKSGAGKKRKR